MKQFILMLGLVLLTATSVNTAQTNEIWVPPVSDNWVPGIYKEEVASGTAEMVTMNDHLKNLEPMIDPKEKECLAKNIYFEAAIESTAGKMAVAQVTMNRVRSPNYPDSICKVVYQGKHHSNGFPVRDRCQFSWYCDGKSDKISKFDIELYNAIFLKAVRMIGAYNWGSLDDMTKGSTHYHADYVYPAWREQKTKMITIGNHIFYKWEESK